MQHDISQMHAKVPILPWYKENIHMLQRQLQDPAQKGKHTPSSPRKRANVAWSSGLVKISASWSCVDTWASSMFPFSTLSLLCVWFWNGAQVF